MRPARSKQLRRVGAKSRSGQLIQDPVEVFCRVRPISPNLPSCLQVISPTTVQFTPSEGVLRNGTSAKEVQYTFKSVFDDGASQGEVFENVALQLVRQLIAGKNGLLFTYGVTGSGKTYTMTGEPQNPGIMPRCLEVLFNTISSSQARKFLFKPDKMNGFEIQDEEDAIADANAELQGLMQPKTPKTPRRREADKDFFFCRDSDSYGGVSLDEDNKYSCFVTYVEIYNNSVFDLLDPNEESITRKVQTKVIREDANRNMYVHGVTEVEVKSPEEALEVFSRGQGRRKVAHTMLNDESSRSHSVFNIRLVQAPLDEAEDDAYLVKKLMTISQLSLVDLAGSERTNRTKNTGQRLREAGSINNSLMTLRTCLEILRENQTTGACRIVPYRESRLTHLFKNYFDGEGAVRMVVCVNPRTEDSDETAQVLKFAEISQEVQVPRPTPQRVDMATAATPSRRRAQMMRRDDDIAAAFIEPLPVFPPLNMTWCSLMVKGPYDEETLNTLEEFLMQRQTNISSSLIEKTRSMEELRPEMLRTVNELTASNQDNIGLRGLLELERKKNKNNEDKLNIDAADRFEMMQKLNERDQLIRQLQADLSKRELVINQQGIEKEKVKEKLQMKQKHQEKKSRREFHHKLLQTKEEFEEQMRAKDEKLRHIRETLEDYPNVNVRPRRGNLPLTTRSVNTAGTLFQPPSLTGTPGPSRPAISNPRRRRSRSAGGGENWLDHRPALPVELDTVFQPTMRKRKSITKLTEMKDVVNSKTSKYCLTTQEQDTDGELETKLYKGDVIPTSTGGAQVILHDVETLKQTSPTSVHVRKRSMPDENTEARCRLGIEGHGKKQKS